MFSKLRKTFNIVQCPECKRQIGTHLKYKCSIHNKEQEQSLWEYINGKLPVCDEDGTKHFTDSVIHCTDSQDGLLEFLLGNYEKNKFHLDCNATFPEGMLKPNIEVRRICLAGTTQSGKTVFKARLKETLLKTFAPAAGITVPDLKFEFKGDVNHEKLPSRTDVMGNKNIPPEYIAFNRLGKTYLLVIYDIAGEDLSDEAEKLKWQRSISIVDNIFVFLDPVSNFNIISEDKEELNSAEKAYKQIKSLVDFIIQYSEKQHNLKHKFAFIVSKIDQPIIWKKFRDCSDKLTTSENALLWNNDSPVYPDYSAASYNSKKFNIENIVKSFIEKYSDYNYTHFFDTNDEEYKSVDVLEDVKYFAMSALGLDCEISDENTEVHLSEPYRLLDPIMWIL